MELTAKEKARELVDCFKSKFDYMVEYGYVFEAARQCALIHVRGVISAVKEFERVLDWAKRQQIIENNCGVNYWVDVEKELEKMK